MQLLAGIHHLDLRLFSWINRLRYHQQCAVVARFISKTGDGHLYVAIPLLLLILGISQAWQLTIALIVGFSLERSLYYVMKTSCKRRRPPEAIPGFRSLVQAHDKFSFPSGHTSGAFLMVTIYFGIYGEACILLYGWASMVGISRIFLGVHFPGDVVVGALLGTVMGYWTAPELAGLVEGLLEMAAGRLW